ncbi:hypothetical protein [Limosilactobacillus antri]|uniref:hypothetical protein n=1 Tax=Limosilactobacillus antri TaxID=227943 RepID=UPI0030B82A16
MEKAKQKQPFHVAVVQLGTYDGTIANAHQIIKNIGHLCDYILFDSAWVGYEQFIPFYDPMFTANYEVRTGRSRDFNSKPVSRKLRRFTKKTHILKGRNAILQMINSITHT